MISSFKSKAMGTAIAACAATFAAGTAHAEGSLNIYNWSDYIDEAVLAEFEAETGIKVKYDVFDSNEILETKLLAGVTGYDIVVPSGTFLSRQIQAGVFQELDKSALPNLKNMWSVVSERTALYDPGNKFSINYLWGTTGIGYNVDAAAQRLDGKPVDSWEIFFNPAILARFQDCGVHVLDAPAELIPAALNYLGLNPDSHDKADIAKAAELLKTVRPYVQKFHSSEYINALANGDICLAVGWSGDVFQARDRANEAKNGVKVNYIIPKEGALMWFDQMVITSDATNVKEAHIFLDYIMRPEVIAKSTNYVVYANGNEASQQFIDAEILEDKAVYPDDATLEKIYVTTPYAPKIQRIVTRAWTAVKTGQ
ncbi:polyamine ABC transporter substrate-binding protein [Pseudovibrio sp. Tun.PSC04-5.I4]|uniref:polyamine ABC transporter substrate-binding protein n=1 Tax=Pseudovibrio sp. Tun.PSC04-5.I4 TaxID=1798213 RepID=UPI0008920D39|nr:polyamine ABC transporter substrate-binding protein [Pseudovibrio sp. Tun.PSC04-5.I4]SDR14062.1 putrescine transport system substrate-binding protein [Pseudovibrio sp. Tun.PSC04-5.I4]